MHHGSCSCSWINERYHSHTVTETNTARTFQEILLNLIRVIDEERLTQRVSNAEEFLVTHRRLVASSPTIWVYSCNWDHAIPIAEEVPVTVRMQGPQAPTDGRVVGYDDDTLWLGVRNNLGAVTRPVYVRLDVNSLFLALADRFRDIERNHHSVSNRPVGRLLSNDGHIHNNESSPRIQMVTTPNVAARHEKVKDIVLDGLRKNNRMLLTSAHNRDLDESLVAIVRAMRMEGLSYSTLVTRYPALVLEGKGTTDLRELAFEQQLRTNADGVRSDQATLRSLYHRYQKLVPRVAFAQEKTQDLEEIEVLEDRILDQISTLERKDTDLRIHVETYEDLPLWQRLSMQIGGKNPPTMKKMRSWCAKQLERLQKELGALQPRLSQARQEAYLSPDVWLEYEHIMESFDQRGGLEKVRSLIAQQQGTSDHFLQRRGLVAATAGCIASHDLFNELSFDTVIVDGFDTVPLPLLIPVACPALENIILVSDQSNSSIAAEQPRARLARLRTSILVPSRMPAITS